jgi:hypothetical protein
MMRRYISQVFLRPFCVIWRGDGPYKKYSIHARPLHYGHPRYDFVRVDSGDAAQPWYARLIALFDVQELHSSSYQTMALVWWLDELAETHVRGATTLVYSGRKPDAIAINNILRPVRMATSPRLLPRPASRAYILLPYGKAYAV